MIGQIASLLITAYLLFLFPVLLGTLFMAGKEKEIGTAYLKGMVVSLGLFLPEAYIADYFTLSIRQLANAYAVTVGIASVAALAVLVISKGRLKAPKLYRFHYLAVFVITLLFAGLRLDTSGDDVLETALMAVWSDRMFAFSPYTGLELAGREAGGYLPVFYAVLSKISGLHVTMAGKLMMPFAAAFMGITAYRLLLSRILGKDTKRSWYGLWMVLFLWLFLCFPGLPGYWILWEAPWTPECLIFICFLPMLIYLLSRRKWNGRFSFLLAFLAVDIGLTAGADMRSEAKGSFPLLMVMLFLFALFRKRILWLLRHFIGLCCKKNVKNYGIPIGMAALSIASVFLGGCIITNSAYGMPDNRYKINAEVMQIRIMAEPMASPKMLAPPEVAAQIRDGDLKVSLVFGPDAGDYSGNDGTLIRQKEIADDLKVNGYDAMKLIQHGMAEGCDLIVAYKAGEEQEEIFERFGFSKLGETDSYIVYETVP